jgi:ABC-type spermidine/putrescine transport system permease subunit I
MLGQLMVDEVSKQLDWGLAGAMAITLTAVTLVLVAATTRVVRIEDVFASGPVE